MKYQNELDRFIADNKADMLADLIEIVKQSKEYLSEDNDFSCDVRLCIDRADTRHGYGDSNVGFKWIIRVGQADYDQRHSEYCSASCIGQDTDAEELLKDLIERLD